VRHSIPMRRRLDVLLVAAVAAIAVVAGLDAFGGGGEGAAVADSAAEVEEAAAALGSLGATGRLIASDSSCRRFYVELPSLVWTEIPRITGCRVYGRRGSLGVRDGEVGWYAFPGAVTLLLTRVQLAGELGGDTRAREVFVTRAAWLRSTRFAALVAGSGVDGMLLAIFERSRLLREPALLDAGFVDLRASRSFGYVAALGDGGRLALFDREGERVALPQLPGARSIAWSPDERLTAVATDEGVAVFPSGRADGPVAVIPVQAEDLDWLR
jgi:hypothetical protein